MNDKFSNQRVITIVLVAVSLYIFVLRWPMMSMPALLGAIIGWVAVVLLLRLLASFVIRKLNRAEKVNKIGALNIALVIYLLLFVLIFLFNNSSGTGVTSTPTQLSSNPDYLKDPSQYMVDSKNTISSQIPLSKALWVEDVVNSVVLKVSFTVVKAGQKIIVFKNLGIPGINYMQRFSAEDGDKNSKCREKESVNFLNSNLLHKEIYLVEENPPSKGIFFKGWRLFTPYGADVIDVATLIIRNGYGNTPFHIPGYGSEELKEDSILPYPGRQFHATLFGDLAKTLKDEGEVARLAKRGFWGTCQ